MAEVKSLYKCLEQKGYPCGHRTIAGDDLTRKAERYEERSRHEQRQESDDASPIEEDNHVPESISRQVCGEMQSHQHSRFPFRFHRRALSWDCLSACRLSNRYRTFPKPHRP